MRHLTDHQLAPIYDEIVATKESPEWDDCGTLWPAKMKAFANAILAKYGNQPDERAILERERKAWDAGTQFALGQWTPAAIPGAILLCVDRERDRRYPLPSPEPTPVLTVEEIDAIWEASPRNIPIGYFARSRQIEAAVQRKLAQQQR